MKEYLRRLSSSYSEHSGAASVVSIDSHVSNGKIKAPKTKPVGGSWIELFYDLFFAASLSTFSRIRELASIRDLIDLGAFFTILWWTWTSQTLFDVRFARCQKNDKLIKFLALSIMIGYGVFEGEFSLFVTELEPHDGAFVQKRTGPRDSAIAISVLFILSRLQLALQYYLISRRSKTNMQVLRKKAALPSIAAVFWIVSLFFVEHNHGELYVIRTSLWSAGILTEVLGAFIIRYQTQAGFEKTHMTERFGSLTIILLGEGIIKLVSILRDIHTGVGFTWRSVIAIVTSVWSFYLLWALYFQGFDLSFKLGKLKAYTWAYLHFFFHLSLVLVQDGIASLLLFTNISGGITRLLDMSTESAVMQDLFTLHTNQSATRLHVADFSFTYDAITTTMSNNGTELSASEYNYVFIQLFTRIGRSYNVRLSEDFLNYVKVLIPTQVTQENVTEAFKLLLEQFTTAAQFFLLAGGLLLWSLIPIMWLQGRITGSSWIKYIPIMMRILVGAILLSVAGLADFGVRELKAILESGFMVPGFTAAIALVYGTDRGVTLLMRRYRYI